MPLHKYRRGEDVTSEELVEEIIRRDRRYRLFIVTFFFLLVAGTAVLVYGDFVILNRLQKSVQDIQTTELCIARLFTKADRQALVISDFDKCNIHNTQTGQPVPTTPVKQGSQSGNSLSSTIVPDSSQNQRASSSGQQTSSPTQSQTNTSGSGQGGVAGSGAATPPPASQPNLVEQASQTLDDLGRQLVCRPLLNLVLC